MDDQKVIWGEPPARARRKTLGDEIYKSLQERPGDWAQVNIKQATLVRWIRTRPEAGVEYKSRSVDGERKIWARINPEKVGRSEEGSQEA